MKKKKTIAHCSFLFARVPASPPTPTSIEKITLLHLDVCVCVFILDLSTSLDRVWVSREPVLSTYLLCLTWNAHRRATGITQKVGRMRIIMLANMHSV